jgi:hypothetical protein
LPASEELVSRRDCPFHVDDTSSDDSSSDDEDEELKGIDVGGHFLRERPLKRPALFVEDQALFTPKRIRAEETE